jgi:hypothetical protein
MEITGDKMKELLSVLLTTAICLVLSHEAWGLDIKYNGEIRFRSFYTNNLSDAHDHNGPDCPGPDGSFGTSDDTCDDQEAFLDARFRLRLSATEGFTTGVVMVDFLSQEGRHAATLARSDTAQTGNWRFGSGSDGFGGSLDTLFLREAYLHTTISWFHVVLGRQAIQLGHRLIMDDTADALVFGVPLGPVSLTVGGFKLIESDSHNAAVEGSDTDAYFSHLAWVPAARTNTSLFIVHLRDRGPGLKFNGPCGDPTDPDITPPAYQICDLDTIGDDRMLLYVLGWTLDTNFNRFHLGLEADFLTGKIFTDSATTLNLSGEDIDLRGFNGLIQLDLILPGVQAGLTGLYASGQEQKDIPELGGDQLNINAISPNFVLGNILVNNETTSDRDGGDIGGLTAVKLTLERSLWLGIEGELAVIWARLTERPATGVDPDLGWEIDLNSTYPLDDHLLLISGFGFLFPGEGWQGLFGDPEAEDLQVKLTTKLIYTF